MDLFKALHSKKPHVKNRAQEYLRLTRLKREVENQIKELEKSIEAFQNQSFLTQKDKTNE